MVKNPQSRRWVVIVDLFTAFVTLGMSIDSMQYFYGEILERFGESAAVTARPVSLFLSLKTFQAIYSLYRNEQPKVLLFFQSAPLILKQKAICALSGGSFQK